MKSNKLLIALALCVAVQPGISLCGDVLRAEIPAPMNQSFYQQYAPQRMQDFTGYVSKQATSAYNTVNSWSTQKKIAVLTGLLLSLGVSAYVINRIISNDIPVVNNEFGSGNSNDGINVKAPDASMKGYLVHSQGAPISHLERDYARTGEAYLKNNAEYYQTKDEFRQAKAAGTLTPELNARVEHLVNIDTALQHKLIELREDMEARGITEDQIKKMNEETRTKVLGK